MRTNNFKYNKLIRYLMLPVIFILFCTSVQSQMKLYVAPGISEETKSDFIDLLNRASATRFTLAPEPYGVKQGIRLEIERNANFKSKESFRLQSNGRDQLVITSSSPEGLMFGFYKHLRNLGFRFYLPDELYTIVPKLAHPFGTAKDIIDQPYLAIRDVFGTGGLGTTNSDPDKKVEKDWKRWYRRNGFGTAYQLDGHRGENFITENYAVLQKNPQWLAKPLTGDPYRDQDIKLNYSNKQGLDFYVDWSLKELASKSFTPPPPSHSLFVSMEPSDGGGFMVDQQGKGTSVSDQVFLAANAAARKLDVLFPKHPKIGVNLYAYSSHAAPPGFKLHPRVFVQLVPYQFQNIAFGPSFIKMWAAKADRFGIYDYFRYPDAQYDLPGGLTLDEVMKRLVHSVRSGSEGTSFETSYSKFATGVPLWVIARYMADGQSGWEANLAQLTRELYGASAGKISELFQLFYRQNTFEPGLMGNATALVQQAAQGSNAAVQERLNELKLYLQYVDLVFQSKDLSKGPLHERLLPLATFAWKIYPQKIIHSYRIMQLVSYAFLNSDKANRNYAYYQQLHLDWFPETERAKTAWVKIPQGVSAWQCDHQFQKLLQGNRPSVLVHNYGATELAPLLKAAGLKPISTLVVGGGSSVRGYFGVFAEKPVTLSLQYRLTGAGQKLVISSIDRGYQFDTSITLTAGSGTIKLPIPKGETTLFLSAGEGTTYRIRADLSEGLFFFDTSPRGKMAFYKNFNDPQDHYTYETDYYPSYFYMPRLVGELNYKVQLNALRIGSPGRSSIPSVLQKTETSDFEVRSLKVLPSETHQLWSAVVGNNYNYQLMNVPDRYFLLKKQ